MVEFPKVAIYSIFRDNEGEYIKKYFNRIRTLNYPKESIRIYCGEGDSEDNTYNELIHTMEYEPFLEIIIIKQDTGRERLYHTPNPYRMKTRAMTGNAVYDKIVKDNWADLVLHLESDLLIEPDMLKNLIDTMPKDAGAYSPMVWVEEEVGQYRMYDTWGFSDLDGNNFPPYSRTWYSVNHPSALYPILTSGSCVLFHAELINDGLRLTDDEEIKGMTRMVSQYIAGHDDNGDTLYWKLYCNYNIHIIHPSESGV